MAAAGAPLMWTVSAAGSLHERAMQREPFAGRVEPFADASGNDPVPIAGAHGLLTVLVLGSVLIGRPFTAPYARAQAPKGVWHNTASSPSIGRSPWCGASPYW
jgi:hypothetical protein